MVPLDVAMVKWYGYIGVAGIVPLLEVVDGF